MPTDQPFRVGPYEFKSRLIVGTGKFTDFAAMQAAHVASGADLVTVAIGRVDLTQKANILEFIDRTRMTLLPNTAGAYTVEDALRLARLARASGVGDLIKVEVLGDPETLLPDVVGTIEATRILAAEGFYPMVYTTQDPIVARTLEEVGAAAVMPLASMIGSGQGFQDFTGLKIILAHARVPIVVDAGLGIPSDAALAMELGADAVLVNTAIAKAEDPTMMAEGFRLATRAGRLGYLAGRIPKIEKGQVSSVGAGFGK
ncbi:MAG: thiazole synthase [bacterium]